MSTSSAVPPQPHPSHSAFAVHYPQAFSSSAASRRHNTADFIVEEDDDEHEHGHINHGTHAHSHNDDDDDDDDDEDDEDDNDDEDEDEDNDGDSKGAPLLTSSGASELESGAAASAATRKAKKAKVTGAASLLHGSHKKNSTPSTVISFVCTTVGAGVVGLPHALAQTGWVGVLLIGLIAFTCRITANYLIACMFAVPGKRLKTYEDIGVAALGPIGRHVVAVFQLITLFGGCSIFLILIGGSLESISRLNAHIWVVVFAAVMVPISWLKTMKEISTLAYFGLFASLVLAFTIVVQGLMAAGSSTAAHAWINPSSLSSGINTIVFAFGGHSVIPVQVNEMKHARRNYRKFSFYAFTLIGSIYAVVATCGYAGYGEDAGSNGVLHNLQSTVAADIARIFITCHLVMAYPLPLNPICIYLEEIFGMDVMPPSQELPRRLVLRTLLVASTGIVALVVPYFGDLLSLVSALSMIVVAFVFPPLFYYLLHRRTHHLTTPNIALMIVIAVCGFIASVIGIYYSVVGLIDDIRDNPDPFANFFGSPSD